MPKAEDLVAEIIIEFETHYYKFNEAKEKKDSFQEAVEALEKAEKKLDQVSALAKNRSIRQTILGMSEAYTFMKEEIEKANEYLSLFKGDHEGPKNLFLFRLSKVCLTNSKKTDWKKVKETILRLKKISPIIEITFQDIHRGEKGNEFQLGRLRKNAGQVKKYSFIKK